MHATHRYLISLGCVAALSMSGCSEATPESPTPTSISPSEASTEPVATQSSSERAETQVPGEGPSPAKIFSAEAVTSGLGVPWSVVFREGVALVSERDSGRILELADDGTTRELAVIERSAARGEGGLLGMAVDDSGRLYVYYTASKDNRIARFDVSGEPGSLTLGEPTIVLEGLSKSTTHNGGRIAFGPDSMLYVTVGDAGVPDRAQDLGSMNGKILRMTMDGGVPADNPFEDSMVWTWGHRNPQGLAWSDDGTMFAAEFGQSTWDELNIIEAGQNYGWPTVEGKAGREDFVDPVQQWSPKVASPSGMAFAEGALWIANLRGEVLRRVPVAEPETSTDYWQGEFGRLRDVAVSPDGHLWVLTNNTDSRGRPGPDDDKILAISAEALSG